MSVGGGRVSVGGMGVYVSVGTGVSVGVGVGVRVGVFVGISVLVGTEVGVRVGKRGVAEGRGFRVRVAGGRVNVGRRVAVSVGSGVSEAVRVGMAVGVGTNSVTDCSVNATAVFRFETASSTIFSGGMVTGT